MQRSETRILTTHVGSLPRAPALRDLLVRRDRGEPVDAAALDREASAAVERVVAGQLDAGIDVINNGEQPRAGFSTYVAGRMRGFGGTSRRQLARDLIDFPDYADMLARRRRDAARIADAPQAVAEVEYADLGSAAAECDVVRDEGERYAERLRAAGVPTAHTRYPGMIHGFFAMIGVLDQAQQAVDEASAWLRATLRR